MGGIIEFPTYWNVESGPDEKRGYYADTAAEAMLQFIESHMLDEPRYEFGVVILAYQGDDKEKGEMALTEDIFKLFDPDAELEYTDDKYKDLIQELREEEEEEE